LNLFQSHEQRIFDDDGGVTVGDLVTQELLQQLERVHRLLVRGKMNVINVGRERGDARSPSRRRPNMLVLSL